MNNFKTSRTGFQYDRVIKTEGTKTDVIRFKIMYLKSSSGRKGVLASIAPQTIEQCDGYTMESFLLYNQANISVFAKMLARKSDKEVLAVAEKLDPLVQSIIDVYQQQGPDAAKQVIIDAVAAQ